MYTCKICTLLYNSMPFAILGYLWTPPPLPCNHYHKFVYFYLFIYSISVYYIVRIVNSIAHQKISDYHDDVNEPVQGYCDLMHCTRSSWNKNNVLYR